MEYKFQHPNFDIYRDADSEKHIQSPYAYALGDRVQFIPNSPLFEIIDRNHGTFGAVYTARSIATDRISAFKSPRFDKEWSLKNFDDFAREGLAWVGLPSHINIVSAHRVVRHNGRPLILMDYLPPVSKSGPSLMDVLRDMPENMVLEPVLISWIIGQLIGTLKNISDGDREFTHGDLKPSNMLLRIDGGKPLAQSTHQMVLLCLSDFGMAIGGDTLQYSPTVAGDIFYLPPEAFAAGELDHPDLTRRVARDMYAIGCTIFELAVCMRWQSIDPDSGYLTTQRDLGFNSESFVRCRPDLEALAGFLATCLSVDPENRPASYTELSELWTETGERHGFVKYQKSRDDGDLIPNELASEDDDRTLMAYLIKQNVPRSVAHEILNDLAMASAYRNLNKISKSNELLDGVLAKIPNFGPAIAAVAQGQMLLQNAPAALQLYALAAKAYDADLIACDQLGYGAICTNMAQLIACTISDRGLIAQGVRLGQAAVAILPEESRSYLSYGLALMRSGNPSTALDILRLGMQKDPSNLNIRRTAMVAEMMIHPSVAAGGAFLSLSADDQQSALQMVEFMCSELTD